MPAGRPTDYTPALIRKAKSYLKNYEEKYKHRIPSIAGLAVVLNKTRETLYAWAKDPEKQEFSDILKELMAKQENDLLNKGLSGEFNSTITKLILTKHGHSEKVATEISGPDGQPIETHHTYEIVDPK